MRDMRSVIVAAMAFTFLVSLGCGNIARHAPGGYDMTPMATMPLASDTSHRRFAATANHSGGYHPDESNNALEVSYTIGKGRSWNRTSFKAFAYGGVYRFDSLVFGLGEREAFYGGGVSVDGDFIFRLGRVVSLGFGGTCGLMLEFGPYTAAFPDASDLHIWPIFVGRSFVAVEIVENTELDIHFGGGGPGFAFYELALFHHHWGFNIGAGAGLGFGGEEPGSGRLTAGLSYGF